MLGVLGVLDVLNVLNVLHVLHMLHALHVLNMPMDASLACRALLQEPSRPSQSDLCCTYSLVHFDLPNN